MKLTQLDGSQISRQVFDEELNANRVYLVNGLNIDTTSITKSIEDAIGNIQVNNQHLQPISTLEYKTLEVPTNVIIKEPQIIYVDRPVIETKFIEIEKQIVVKEQQIVEVKIPEIIKQYDSESKWIKLAFVLLMGMSLLTNIILLIKK